MRLNVIAAVFPVIFLGELPDKTMFASLVLAARGRPLAVWVGAAAAFAVHVVIAVAIGAALFAVVPHRALEALVAAMFLAGAVYSYLIRNAQEEDPSIRAAGAAWRVAGQAGLVIFVAEWGDLTQILTANLAARYHQPLSVGVGSLAALWVVAAVAVASGAKLLRVLSVRTLRLVTSVVLVGLAAYTAVAAAR
ncbi:MAG TPA: TMEM165/GDT1 family protein [Acidimicrobiales bacterium]